MASLRLAQLLCAALQLLLLRVDSQPYTPQVPQKCQHPEREHYVEAINKCCRLCPPGERVQQSCNESIDTQCVPCEEGMFTQAWSRAERCFSCIPQCKAGFVEVKACTRTQNRFCWCGSHQFCQLKLSETCLRCAEHQLCRKGYGVAKPGTSTANVQCAPCAPGTFSDVESPTALCKSHTSCKSVLVPGNSTSDAVCSDPSEPVVVVTQGPPHDPATTSRNPKLPRWPLVTKDPTLSVKQTSSPGISSATVLVVAVAFAVLILVAVILFLAFRNKAQVCAVLRRKEKQPGPWAQDSRAVGQEEQNLLHGSASSSNGSLGSPAGSDKSSEISNISTLKLEVEQPQQRSVVSNKCAHQGGPGSEQAGKRGTQVNVSCVVSVYSPDHSLQFQSPNSSDAADPICRNVAEDDLPLSKEESPGEKEPGKQIAVEVEDSVDAFDYGEGKPPPLSVEDVSMKTT